MTDEITLTLDDAYQLSIEVLRSNGFSAAHAESMARVICACQRDECHSHGLYRLLVCVKTLRSGRVNPEAVPKVFDHAPGVVRVDANKGYSLLAFEAGRPFLVEKARRVGLAALAINRCYHFSALWPEVEALSMDGLAAIAMSPSHSWVAPAGGTKPAFGTNPIAFAWPRPHGNPYVFDFATSAVARGEIELHRRDGRDIPLGWALDEEGQPTSNPAAGLAGAMMTFGGHKGSALAMMIELLAGPLIGDLTSMQSKELDGGVDATPLHGELLIAFDPEVFTGANVEQHAHNAELLFGAVVEQRARLPSQRRYEARERSLAKGAVSIPRQLYEDITALRR